jgi:hypothetical protein
MDRVIRFRPIPFQEPLLTAALCLPLFSLRLDMAIARAGADLRSTPDPDSPPARLRPRAALQELTSQMSAIDRRRYGCPLPDIRRATEAGLPLPSGLP